MLYTIFDFNAKKQKMCSNNNYKLYLIKLGIKKILNAKKKTVTEMKMTTFIYSYIIIKYLHALNH